MRTSQNLIFTLKEHPADIESISHQLMLRSGMIRKLSSGFYAWLPLGMRVLNKTINIIKAEMNKIGAVEIYTPIMQSTNFWKTSGRLYKYGLDLFQLIDRNNRSFILSPTDEEIINHLVHNEIQSYKQLPVHFYQIKTKFRDEMRPRFGIMRTKEFIMKDSYSFHATEESLQTMYNTMYDTYNTIFKRMQLEFYAVQADSGSIGGTVSHEFQAISISGENDIVISSNSNYCVNLELAETLKPIIVRDPPTQEMCLINTSNLHTINDLMDFFSIPPTKLVKTVVLRTNQDNNYLLIALMIRGDQQINELKIKKLLKISASISFASEEEIYMAIGIYSHSIGPVNSMLPVIIDYRVAIMSDFVAGANIDGKHFSGINWERDVPLPQVADLCKIVNGDISPDGKGTLQIKRAIEIAHIFQPGTKYAKNIKAPIQGKSHNQILFMGCYGIGITRIIAAVIEQHHDKNGILWPKELSPFDVAILPINNAQNTASINNAAEEIYRQLLFNNIDVLLDDRKEQPGIMFADIDLIGIPHILIIGNKYLNTQKIEYKNRYTDIRCLLTLEEIIKIIKK